MLATLRLDDVARGPPSDLRAAVLQRARGCAARRLARRCARPVTAALALLAVAVLLVGEVRWAHEKTPPLFDGDPPARGAGARCSGAWLASDVSAERRPARLRAVYPPGVGAQPRLLAPHAAARGSGLLAHRSKHIPRAARPRSLGLRRERHDERGAAADDPARAYPSPRSAFEARVYGPFLVIRSLRPLVTPDALPRRSRSTSMRLGRASRSATPTSTCRTLLRAPQYAVLVRRAPSRRSRGSRARLSNASSPWETCRSGRVGRRRGAPRPARRRRRALRRRRTSRAGRPCARRPWDDHKSCCSSPSAMRCST